MRKCYVVTRERYAYALGRESEIGHEVRPVRVATAELGTGLAYGDGNILGIVVEFERGVEGDKVCKGGGKGRAQQQLRDARGDKQETARGDIER